VRYEEKLGGDKLERDFGGGDECEMAKLRRKAYNAGLREISAAF